MLNECVDPEGSPDPHRHLFRARKGSSAETSRIRGAGFSAGGSRLLASVALYPGSTPVANGQLNQNAAAAERAVLRQSCLKMDLFFGDRVKEVQVVGVQVVASIAGEAGEIFKRLAGWSVKRVADERMADGGQMDSDLMRAARMEADLECCRVCSA